MKNLFTASLILLASQISFAGKAKPDVVCIEKSTKWKYEFYFTQYNEIHIFDQSGKEMSPIDGFHVETKVLESVPSILQYSVIQEGNMIAQIEFRGNSKAGTGEMIDNDSLMSCRR